MRGLVHQRDVGEEAEARLVLGGEDPVEERHRRGHPGRHLQVLVAHGDGVVEGQHVGVHPARRHVRPQRGAPDRDPLAPRRSKAGSSPSGAPAPWAPVGKSRCVEVGRHRAAQLRRGLLAEDDGQHARLVARLERHLRGGLDAQDREARLAHEADPPEGLLERGQREAFRGDAGDADHDLAALADHLPRGHVLRRQHAQRHAEVEGGRAHRADLRLRRGGVRGQGERGERGQGHPHGSSRRGCARRS